MAVEQDAYSKVYVPQTAAQWTELLDGLGIANPSSFWLCNETSGDLTDSGTAGRTVSIINSINYQVAAPGWQRTGVQADEGSSSQAVFTIPDIATTSALLLQVYAINGSQTATRCLNRLSDVEDIGAFVVAGSSAPKLVSTCVAATATGTVNYPSTLVVVTKYDVTNGAMGVYSRGEQLKPTFTAATSSTTATLLGDIGNEFNGTLVYAAYWSGADAELDDATIQDLIDAVYGDSTTLSKMQAGSFSCKLVAAIEGCEYLLTEDCTEAALRAWAGSDWTSALPGLFVEMKNSQTLTPWEPFTSSGSCTLRIADTDGSDTFGILVNRRLNGAESELTETVDRSDTTIKVAATTDFTSSGSAYIGTEAFSYTGTTSTTLTGCTRGLYSPFGCAPSGSGGTRFSNHHRVGPDPYRVETRPVVSQLPRVWLGKRVGVWLHTWDPVTETLNSRDEAQLLFAGRIAGIADDPNTGHTVIDVESVHDEIKNGIVGRDMMSATVAEGLYIAEGRSFAFEDWKYTGSVQAANALTVVASGATGTNQMNAGRYSLSEICEKLSAWLAGEKAAGRIYGYYTWHSPVTSNVGLRSKCYWRIEDAASTPCSFGIDMPGEVMGFLGLTKTEPANAGQTEKFTSVKTTNKDLIAQGESVPFTNLIFKPGGPGRLAQEFSEAVSYTLEDIQGGFYDQHTALPSVIKASCDSTKPWGLWLLNEQALIVGSYDNGVISNCWLAPFQATADKDKSASNYIGRRADEPEGGPITIRQIFMLESSLSTLLATLVYGTGTSGFNHSTYDALGYGFGLGIPGELLGEDFERSLSALPGADAPIAVTFDEPTKFVDLFAADLIVRRAFLRWKDEGFEFAQWKTPLSADAVATLNESNKAAPAGHQENHRIATVESAEHARPVIKIDYCKDAAIGRDGQYLKSVQLEDQTAVDDAGGSVKPYTIKLRNSSHDLQNSGAAVESLIPGFLASMPATARPARIITRSIDLRFFEGYGVGDIVNVADSFARDPLTGRREIGSRTAIITRISYDLGGSSADGNTRSMGGDLEAMFMDLHRGEIYAPAAQVDDTATNAGYDAGTKVLTCYAHKYSHSIQYNKNWGRGQRSHYLEDDADATWFEVGDKVNVIEMDPADPASPQNWSDTVAAQSGNTITLTTGLAGWDPAKKYRIVPMKYSEVVSTQQDFAYQADSTDRMIENIDPFVHYALGQADHAYIANTGDEKAELIPTMAYGDGRPQDPGYDRVLIHSLNGYHDFKSAHQSPCMWFERATAPTSSIADQLWNTLFAGPIFLGFDNHSTVITRTLTVAPFFRGGNVLTAGMDSAIRVTLSRIKPQTGPGRPDGFGPGNAVLGDASYPAEYSQTATWTTTSTTFQTGADKTLSINAKDLTWGYAWLVVEGKYGAVCYGLAKTIEGPRVNTALANALLQGVDVTASYF